MLLNVAVFSLLETKAYDSLDLLRQEGGISVEKDPVCPSLVTYSATPQPTSRRRKLMEAAIAEFKRLGGRELFLESQKRLQPALRLYESVGFELQPGVKPGTHYQRADVYMIYRGQSDAA